MKKIDLYLVGYFFTILAAALVSFVVIFIIVDAVENLDRFIDAEIPVGIIGAYYLNSCPWFIQVGLPMAMLLSTILTIGLLSRRNELVAMKSAGISLYRIALPIFISAVVVSVGSFFFEDQAVTLGNRNRRAIEKERAIRLRKQPYDTRKRNIFLQKSDRLHIAIDRYRPEQKRATGVAMQFLEKGRLTSRVDANWMEWVEDRKAWRIHTYAIREFHPDGFESRVEFSRGDTLLAVNFDPDDITRQAVSPEEKSYAELKLFIQELKDSGVDTTRWDVNLHGKISFAFTNLIVVLFALPLVASKAKGSLAFGAGISVFVIFAYYAFIRIGQTLGYKGILDPFLSAWIGNVVFSLGGVVLLILARK
ncbi:MAG: LptF/LptG family permease [Fidelibacterota bacterium]